MPTKRFITLFFLSSTLLLQANVLDDFMKKITPHHSHKHHSGKRHQKHKKDPVLSEGAQWQTALQFLNYYYGKIDGDLATEETFNAVTTFHAKHNQIATGFLEEEDKQYLSEIYRTIHLSRYLAYEGKNKEKENQRTQAALALLSLYRGKIDGSFGKDSKIALAHYKTQLKEGSKKKDSDIEMHLVNEAKEQVRKELNRLKEDTYDPHAYAQRKTEKEDLLLE